MKTLQPIGNLIDKFPTGWLECLTRAEKDYALALCANGMPHPFDTNDRSAGRDLFGLDEDSIEEIEKVVSLAMEEHYE